MASSIRYLSLYVGLSFLALAVLMLWPNGSDKLLVLVSAEQHMRGETASDPSDLTFFAVASGSNVRLLNKVGRNGFVIAVPAGEGDAIVNQLYRNGAFLVLNASGLGGCGIEKRVAAFRSNNI